MLRVDRLIARDIISLETKCKGPVLNDHRDTRSFFDHQFENEDFLLSRLSNVSRRVSGACASVYFEEFGLSITEWRLLAQIGRFGSISAKDVSERTHLDRVAISRAASKCLSEGLIQEKQSTRDRRSKVLSFTPKGRALYKSIIPRACELSAMIEAGLTGAEVKTLKRLLGKLDEHVSKHDLRPDVADDAA
ncbi:MAG: transcriptional regulator, MarR family [Hyphomicrobiales bacterium]|jgi:DNA-binding MarR family transcriptional regulator|nr:transcriptional regulator, MarR family [Hyphomicrobiales bacterium]